MEKEAQGNAEGILNFKESKDLNFDDKYIKWFSDLCNDDVAVAGGKGASLGEMYNNKFPVPPGFVVTAQSFAYFIENNKLKDKIADRLISVDMEDTAELQNASKEIKEMIINQKMPEDLQIEILEAYKILSSEKIDEKGVSADALAILRNAQEPAFVSVRSSATTEDLAEASFAGQQESFLNVKGENQLIEHIKKCFASLYTARAIYYRNKQGFEEGQSLLAAVVQKMVESEKSGVIFSRDPRNMGEDIVAEAVYGLGEGIVSGKIKPDHYVILRDLKIKKVEVADKKIAIVRTGSGNNETVKLNPERSNSQVLTNGEILEVADYAIKLENHYKKPQDIEFGLEDGKVYILQSRPITTKAVEDVGEISGTPILEGLNASPGIGVGIVKLINDMSDLPKIKQGDILVTAMTNPDMVVSMEKSAAIVTDEGGITSHASIVSREMGIPAVVGIGNATTKLKDGMKITVDGTHGKIYEGEVAKASVAEIKPIVETERIKLKVIVDLPEFAERAAKSGIDTIGLTRIEGIIATSKRHPLSYLKKGDIENYTKLLAEGIEKIIKPFKKMWIRSSDIRSDEYSTLVDAPEKEINPMLGLHGIRFALKNPEILRAELKAIKQVSEKYPDKKLGVMFPLVISVEELREAKKYFEELKLPNMEFGVMIETPAAVQIIDDLCAEGIDFISFGTNDLTQFTLGVDRGEDQVQHLYNETHPAIFSQIKRVIGACRRHKVETSICGQAGSRKDMVEYLYRKGINSISVNADAAYDISVLIHNLEEEWKSKKAKEIGEKENKVEESKQKVNERFVENQAKYHNNPTEQNNPSEINHGKDMEHNSGVQNNPAESLGMNEHRNYRKQNLAPQNTVGEKNANEVIREENKPENKEKVGGILEGVKQEPKPEKYQKLSEEEYKENIGSIEPLNNLETIDEKSDEIKELVEIDKQRQIERNQEADKNVQVSEGEISSGEEVSEGETVLKSEVSQGGVSLEGDVSEKNNFNSLIIDNQKNEIEEDEIKEQEEVREQEGEPLHSEGGVHVLNEVETSRQENEDSESEENEETKDGDFEEKSEESKESKDKDSESEENEDEEESSEEEFGGMPNEQIGVYNPDEESNENNEYNYNSYNDKDEYSNMF